MEYSIYRLVKCPLITNELISQVLKSAASKLSLPAKTQISLVLSSPAKIKSLNQKYRGKDKVTDVLSFSQKEGRDFPGSDQNYLGEIIICCQQAKKQAKLYGKSFSQEFAFLLSHGLLHLLGYTHGKKADRLKMEKMQEQIIKVIKR